MSRNKNVSQIVGRRRVSFVKNKYRMDIAKTKGLNEFTFPLSTDTAVCRISVCVLLVEFILSIFAYFRFEYLYVFQPSSNETVNNQTESVSVQSYRTQLNGKCELHRYLFYFHDIFIVIPNKKKMFV